MLEPVRRRIHELDLLRGFFIFVIIVDHLQFWPNPLMYLTGEGRLWVSAAEGFFLISGLLIGYIRGYKGRSEPMSALSIKLLRRAFMLYIWGVGITFFVTCFTLLVAHNSLLPALPSAEQLSSPFSFISSVISTNYFNSWIYFLRLYAIMLAVSPIFIWLLRRGDDRLIIASMLSLYIISFVWPEGALQWQLLFFGSAFVGYRFETIISYLREHAWLKRLVLRTFISITAVTMVVSFFLTHGWGIVEPTNNPVMSRDTFVAIRDTLNPFFSSNPMSPGRVLLSFIWFGGLLAFFHVIRHPLMRFGGWILMPFGQRSLTAYCLQAFVLPFIVVIVSPASNPFFNVAVVLAVELLILMLVQRPIVQKLLPR